MHSDWALIIARDTNSITFHIEPQSLQQEKSTCVGCIAQA